LPGVLSVIVYVRGPHKPRIGGITACSMLTTPGLNV